MPYPTDITYPAAATNAAWQKKKSVVDKLIKTKAGPALLTAEAKWKAITFADLNASKISKTPASAKSALDKANAAWKEVVAAREALKSAITLTNTQSNNSKLSKTSRDALKAIYLALKAADKRLELMDDIVPALQVDLHNATETAKAKWANLEIKLGNQIVAHAKTAQLMPNKTYEVHDITWGINSKMALDLLQKDVSVSAHDGTGQLINRNMKITGTNGDSMIRLA